MTVIDLVSRPRIIKSYVGSTDFHSGLMASVSTALEMVHGIFGGSVPYRDRVAPKDGLYVGPATNSELVLSDRERETVVVWVWGNADHARILYEAEQWTGLRDLANHERAQKYADPVGRFVRTGQAMPLTRYGNHPDASAVRKALKHACVKMQIPHEPGVVDCWDRLTFSVIDWLGFMAYWQDRENLTRYRRGYPTMRARPIGYGDWNRGDLPVSEGGPLRETA
jgi:hypothetical protein